MEKSFMRIFHTALKCLFAATCVTSATAEAKVFYLSPGTGEASGSGEAPDTAFHSFEKAAQGLRPGDSLIIEGGTYRQSFRISVSGAPGAPIQIRGADGARPEVRAADDAVVVDGDFVVVSHLDAVGTSGSGFSIQPNHHHVTIKDSVAHDSGAAGISAIQTDYISILRNKVFRNSNTSPWQGSGISLYQAKNIDDVSGFHNFISGNIVFDNYNKVPDPKLPTGSAGHTTDGNGIIIDDFRHTQVWMGKKTAAYRAATLIENNVTFQNGGRGIQIFLSDNVTIRNNTIYANVRDQNLLGTKFGEIQAVFSSNISVYNNIMSPTDARTVGFYAYDAHSIKADANLTTGAEPTSFSRSSAISWGGHNIISQSPGFRATGGPDAGSDFHLTAQSAAVGTGDPHQAPAEDIDGIARKPSGPIDIGAYQFGR